MTRTCRVIGFGTLLLASLGGCVAPPPPTREAGALPRLPEAAGPTIEQRGHAARHHAIATAHPLATAAGNETLRAGGSAVDAAITAQLVLGLVEPQSSGLGGGAFLLHWDGKNVRAYDGRETAPAAADERLFLGEGGKPLGFHVAAVGGRSVGVPGTLRMLELAHRQHGRLPWKRLFEPAIRLAEDGFPVGPRLHALLRDEPHLKSDVAAARFYYRTDGSPHPVGTVLRNPALAAVLRAVAEGGADAFHRGAIARSIVARVRSHPTSPGRLTESDLADYRPRMREALCTDWQRWRICGFPPPSSGHIAVAQILGMLDPAALLAEQALRGGLPGADFLHRYTEAARLAFADRAQYVADPDFVDAPAGHWTSLLEPDYLRQRAQAIGPRSMRVAQPGVPGRLSVRWAPQPAQLEYGTTHLSIVDAQGQAIAMTSTIEDQFGARMLVDGGSGLPGGFLLNNELTDFSFLPADAQGRPIANRVQPGKRPRSSMSPTLVFDRETGALQMSAGSPGGALIIHYTAKLLLGTLAWGLDAQQAAALPNFGSTNGPTLLEAGRFPPSAIADLAARGHEVREIPMTSGIQAIERRAPGWFGGADPRREGRVMGD